MTEIVSAETAENGMLNVAPIAQNKVLKEQVYDALRETISKIDIYSTPNTPRLDERKLADELGVSRTPVREALSRLEQEGFVRNIPRRGMFLVRKTKHEVLEVVYAWAALESMAGRLVTEVASDEEIASLRGTFATLDNEAVRANINEYSDANIHFHSSLIALSRCELIISMTDSLFLHMRAIRAALLKDVDNQRSQQSVEDHIQIIEALEQRNTDRAEKLIREHALSLARHIEQHARYLD